MDPGGVPVLTWNDDEFGDELDAEAEGTLVEFL